MCYLSQSLDNVLQKQIWKKSWLLSKYVTHSQRKFDLRLALKSLKPKIVWAHWNCWWQIPSPFLLIFELTLMDSIFLYFKFLCCVAKQDNLGLLHTTQLFSSFLISTSFCTWKNFLGGLSGFLNRGKYCKKCGCAKTQKIGIVCNRP